MPSQPETRFKRTHKREHATLYDAVAGRVGYEGFLTAKRPSRYRDTASTSAVAVPPEEVLFRRRNAPDRYEEDDIYNADRYLTSSQRLPESDLLKAIHTYVSEFYSSELHNGANGFDNKLDFRNLDETALLAMAILLEEAARGALGETGHLALVEPIETDIKENLSKIPITAIKRSRENSLS